jgi:hypothetical protein
MVMKKELALSQHMNLPYIISIILFDAGVFKNQVSTMAASAKFSGCSREEKY